MGLFNTIPSTITSSAAAPTSVAASITSVTVLAANAARKGATILNAGTANLFAEMGSTATTAAYTAKINTGGYYEVPFGYTGVISGIWDVANGSALVREFT